MQLQNLIMHLERTLRHSLQHFVTRLGFSLEPIPSSILLKEIKGHFKDDKGRDHVALKNYRNRVWRQSRANTNPLALNKKALRNTVKRYAPIGLKQKKMLVDYLQTQNIILTDKNILEIGCYSGAFASAIANECNHLTAIDSTQLIAGSNDKKLIEQTQIYLNHIRGEMWNYFNQSPPAKSVPRSRLAYHDCKLQDFSCEKEWDIIVSFDVLEHVLDIDSFLKKCKKVLKKKGILITFYHPFFCETGAHFDRTSIPWGHCALKTEELDRYYEEFESIEAKIAKKSLRVACNRLTRRGFHDLAIRHKFDIIEDCPIKLRSMEGIPEGYVSMAQEIYPDISMYDFLAEYCLVVLKPQQSRVS